MTRPKPKPAPRPKPAPVRMARLSLAIDEVNYTLRPLPGGGWRLRPAKGEAYQLTPAPDGSGRWDCSCEDFRWRKRNQGLKCKHLAAATVTGLLPQG